MDDPITTRRDGPVEPQPMPRLGLRHFFLWTLCSAGYLGLLRAMILLEIESGMPQGYATLRRMSSVFQSVFMGAVLTGAIVLVTWRVRHGPPLLRHPGHWLVLIVAVLYMAILPLYIISLLRQDPDVTGHVLFVGYAVVQLAAAVVLVYAVRREGLRRWKLIFGALSVLAALEGLRHICLSFGWYRFELVRWVSMVETPTQLLLSIGIVIVSVVEFVHGQRRDWVHWTGVAAFFARSGVSLFWMIGVRFIGPN